MRENKTKAAPSARPVAPYMGGKKQLAADIVRRIEAIPHQVYAEAFVGMAGVFLRRSQPAKGEIINDRSGDVATFFRILQRHYVPFMEMLKWQLTGRREFERLKASDPATLTDLERAARFLYLQRTAFGGKIAGRVFGLEVTGARFNITKLAPLLEDLHERLAGVVIECLPWQDFVRRYDRPETLFYLDPPYFGGENDYGAGLFKREEYGELAETLRGIKGRFLLSINDVPEIRKLFGKGFALTPVRATYTVARGEGTAAKELIITGA